MLGAGPAAVGLAGGFLVQVMFFAPTDMPIFFVNVTTLLFPLFVINALAKRIIPEQKAFVDCNYSEVIKLSFVYQGGVIAWVAFWTIYSQGSGAENMSAVASFGAAYLLVVLIELVADLAVLAGAKLLCDSLQSGLFTQRLFNAA